MGDPPLTATAPTTRLADAVDLPDLRDDPYLKVLRPLVEAYLAFWRADSRHIRSLKLTTSQFDVIATLGDTNGLTCAELSRATLVTKGTLTGVLDRLEAKGLVRRQPVAGDKRATRVCLTDKGDAVFRKTFAAHVAFLRPYFQRAMTIREAEVLRALLLRIRESFDEKVEVQAQAKRGARLLTRRST
jgi:DNA-binding MarR family transcriptional regulator